MSAPRRWARRAALSVLAGGGLTAGLGAPLPGAALGAEPPAGAAGGAEGSTSTQPTTGTTPQEPAPAPGAGAGESPTTTSTTPSPAAGSSSSSSGSATAPTTSGSVAPPTATVPTTPAPAAPTVVVQRPQRVTAGTRTGASTAGGGGSGSAGAVAGGSGGGSVPAQGGTGAGHNGPAAVPPGTPNGVAPAPQAAGGEVSSLAALLTGSAVSAQALDYFRVPLFLLPIYKAAAFQYDVPWQVLAAINEVETDYGTDLSVSTAGAVGWMQFMPATWQLYGVDATFAGYADPYNPADAVFAAARYLHAAGASHNLDAAILAYNHSQAYVESVVLRARLLASFPRSVIGTLTGLVDGRAPTPGARVLAPASTAGSSPAAPAPGEGAAVAPTSSAPGGPAAPTPSAAAAGVTAGTAAAPGTTVATPSGPTAGSAGQGAVASTASAAHAAAAPATPGSTPAPSPQVAAARARAAANAPAKPSQLVEVLGVPGAPVVAVQNGRVVHLGRSRALGRYLVLRDVYGDLFTYAGLGSIAPRYRPSIPALARGHTGATPSHDPAPTLPASAGHQRPVTLRVRAHAAPASPPVQAQGAAAPAGVGRVRLFAHPGNPLARAAARSARRSTGTGSGRWLALRTGAIVSEGTVLGHLSAPAGASVGRLRFAVRPAGDSGTIDPRPLLENWSELDRALHPKGSRSTGALLGATAGDVLSMSHAGLERAVLADTGIGLNACGRRDVTAGAVDARVLAALLFLSRSGLQPTATLRCPRGASVAAASGPGIPARAGGELDGVDITALNGVPVAGHQGPGTLTDAAIRTLLTLRGRFAPHRIVSLMSYPEAPATHALTSAWGHIAVDFPLSRPTARVAAAHTATATGPAAASPLAVTGELSGTQWSELIARIAALPQPSVAARPSAVAIRDPQAAPTNRGLGAGG